MPDPAPLTDIVDAEIVDPDVLGLLYLGDHTPRIIFGPVPYSTTRIALADWLISQVYDDLVPALWTKRSDYDYRNHLRNYTNMAIDLLPPESWNAIKASDAEPSSLDIFALGHHLWLFSNSFIVALVPTEDTR